MGLRRDFDELSHQVEERYGEYTAKKSPQSGED